MRSIVLGSEWALNSHFILQLFSPDFFPLDNQIRPLASLASPWPLTLKLKVDFGKDGVTHFLKISLPCGATEHCSSYFASLFTIISAFLQVRHSVQFSSVQFNSVQLLSHVWLFVTPWTAAREASLSITSSRSSPKLMSIESVMPSNHLILCRPLLLLPSIFPRFRVFSNESTLCIRWPKYWRFSFNMSPFNVHSGLISFMMDWLDILAVKGLSKVFSNTTVQKH